MEKQQPLTLSLTGTFNSGKSTVASAIVGVEEEEVMPTGYQETTSCSVYPIVDPVKCSQRIFTRIDNTGDKEDLPLEKLLETMDDDTAEELIFYIKKSPILSERLQIVDVAGSDSAAKHSHNRRAAKFVRSMTSDVYVNVVSDLQGLDRIFSNNSILPAPHIILVNKIDEQIKWADDPYVHPESVIEETINRTKAHVADLIGESDIVLDIHCCSAIAGLAGQVWSNDILQMILRCAEAGELDLLSAHHFFNTEINGVPSIDERKAISVAANKPLIGTWRRASDTAYQPAFPAIRYSIALAITEGLTTAETLRLRIIQSSGIQKVRSALAALTEDRVIADALMWRRERLQEAEDLATDIQHIKKDITENRVMREHVQRLRAMIDGPLGKTEFLQRCDALATYLERDELAENFRTVSLQLSSLRQHYLRLIRPKQIIT